MKRKCRTVGTDTTFPRAHHCRDICDSQTLNFVGTIIFQHLRDVLFFLYTSSGAHWADEHNDVLSGYWSL